MNTPKYIVTPHTCVTPILKSECAYKKIKAHPSLVYNLAYFMKPVSEQEKVFVVKIIFDY
jgi:hypothetical protein